MASTNRRSRKRRLDSVSSVEETERKKLRAYTEREDNLRSLATCKICFRMLYEPYTLGCGHTYCYSCLCQWFENAEKKKKTCPDCRTVITKAPAPAYALREMVRELLRRPELLPESETIADHNQNEMEEAALVEQDKANADPVHGGLFKGRFLRISSGAGPIHDLEDGVMRCPSCAYELEGDPHECGQCGFLMDVDSEDDDWREDGNPSEEDSEDEDLDGDLDMDDAEFDETSLTVGDALYDIGNYSDQRSEPFFHGFGTPPLPYADFHSSSPSYHTAGSDASGEDNTGEGSDSEDDTSLNGFVARDEDEIIEVSDSDSTASNTTATPISNSRRGRRVIDDNEDDEGEEDEGEESDSPVIQNIHSTHGRRPQRVVISSSDESESDDSDVRVVSATIRNNHNGRSRLACLPESSATESGSTSNSDGNVTDRDDETDQTGRTSETDRTNETETETETDSNDSG